MSAHSSVHDEWSAQSRYSVCYCLLLSVSSVVRPAIFSSSSPVLRIVFHPLDLSHRSAVRSFKYRGRTTRVLRSNAGRGIERPNQLTQSDRGRP